MAQWIIELEDGSLQQSADLPGTMGTPEGARYAETPRMLDFRSEGWDWEAGEIVCRFTPADARVVMWERAKAYREERRNAPLAVWGVLSDPPRPVICKMDIESRLTISGAVQMASLYAANGLPFSFSFDDEAGQEVTIDGIQTIALGLNVGLFSGMCDSALKSVRGTLAAALAGGGTANDIFAIDITAGYPAADLED